MSPQPSQFSQNRNTRIPQRVQQVMNQKMQQTMPAHLKQYQTKGAYVPKHAEQAMVKHMQKAMPVHMKKYAAAYVQQTVVAPSGGMRSAMPQPAPSSVVARAPTVMQFSQEDNYQPTPAQPTAPGQIFTSDQAGPQAAPISGDQAYDFIVNPERPSRGSLFGNASAAMRAIMITGGLLALLIVFTVLRSVLGGGNSNLDTFVSIAQQQQSMIRLTENALLQKDISVTNKNFATTAKLSLISAKQDTLTYMQTNGKKISTKTLNLKINPALDEQLTAAAAATTYNQTFKEIMQAQLTQYNGELSRAYDQSKGEKGRALLSDQYKQAQLLLEQLNTPAR